MLHFRILGPLELANGTRSVRLQGALQSRLLLTLLVNADQLVITDDIIGELWPGRQPERVENALQAHVSRLRHKLAELEPEASEPRLVTHTSGYQLRVGPGQLDIERFRTELEEIRASSELTPGEAARRLREALTVWRGPVLGGLSGGPICEAATVRYTELHISALELLFDFELESGNHAGLVPELRPLITKYPYHERFWQQHMIALYRCGRQAEALVVYRELWSRLTDELGLEPTPAMREYERAILDGDAGLGLSLAAAP